MANKEKNKKEPYLLSDEEHIGEIQKRTITTYDEKDRESKSDEISKAIKKARPEDVSYNEDGSISVKEGDVNEVEKSQVLKFDLKRGQDVKALQQMLDKQDIQRGKITVGTDGTITVSEGLNKKINLSESDIIRIIEENEKVILKKSEIIETIQNNLISEARMEDSVRRNFESGENDYSDMLDPSLINQLAQESFNDIADNIRRKTGNQNVTLDDVQRLLSGSIMDAAREEYRMGIENLERKAVEMIRKEYNVPADAVDFDAKITGIPSKMLVGRNVSDAEAQQLSRQLGVKVGNINREGLKMEKGNSQPPQGKTHEDLKPAVKRRRLTNAMIHGAARKSQNLHHLDDQLRQENPQLGQSYANIMAANDASYFMMDDQTIKSQGQQGIHAGNVKLDLSNPQKPKIIAQGMVFPILLHELAKGVLELMSLWGLPKKENGEIDLDAKNYVYDKTDNLEFETNDIRLGTKIWERFVQQIPMDNQEAISLTWEKLQSLSDSEYNSIIEGLIQNRTEAQQKVRRLADEAIEELRSEYSEDVFGGYEDSPRGEDDEDDDVATPEEDGDDEGKYSDPLLKKLLGGEEEEDETPQEVGNIEDMSDNELRELMASAIENEDYEFASQIRDILKNR
jgi:hypothetical protein